MRHLKKIIFIFAFAFLGIGVILSAVGFFTGGTPSAIELHGQFALFYDRLQQNIGILQNDFFTLLNMFGL